jgi:hypothetical protein
MHKTLVFLGGLKHTYMHDLQWQKDEGSARQILRLYRFPSCDCYKGEEVFEMD